MRGHLRSLAKAGVLERRRDRFPGAVGYELTPSGRGLLKVARVLAVWLARSPQGPIELGTAEAKNATKALVEGWATSIVRALSGRPFSLTELDQIVTCLSYPSLERRLAAMRLLGLVEAIPSRGRGTPYAATDWLRNAVAPLGAAARWEQRHQPEQAPPITNLDVETAFLLVLPLVRLREDLSGSCRLGVQMGNGDINRLAGVMAEAKEGAIVFCVARLDGSPDAWVAGSPTGWFSAVIHGDLHGLELGGEAVFAAGLVDAMHDALARSRV
jgi:DNA-binding HxlR family transcriptional regulator